MNKKVTFKSYDMNQLKLPIDLEVDVSENHLVKIVNKAIERMDLTVLINKYKGGGTSAYHPMMMLKVLVYAYTQKIYTARKIAKALRENIYFMWISGKQTPNFRTINLFRSTIMKEDHMLNGQLKPGYNVQIGTENQFILNYSIHQEVGDTSTLPNNLEKFKNLYGKYPSRVIADSGYGSEENYEYLKEKEIEGYEKYNYLHKEQKKSLKKQIYRVDNLKYDEEKDEYICPNNKRLTYQYTQTDYSKLGYKKTIRKYTCEDCRDCANKKECTKSQSNRSIQINLRQNELRAEAREKLLSEEGIRLRKKRCVDVESVFGQIKWNGGFKRFLMGGLAKVNLEWGLIAIAHNFRKWAFA